MWRSSRGCVRWVTILAALAWGLTLQSCSSRSGGAASAAARGPAGGPGAGGPLPAATAKDAFVLLSGGGTPLSNNYSQFLQARALNAWLRARYPAEAIWTFFGAGNRAGEAPVFGDTRRQLKEDGLLIESWLPGVLEGNRPATHAEVVGALKNEVLPRVASGGTLYLFVGDHGELSRDSRKESAITLWQMKKTGADASAWRSDADELLSVTELSALLQQGVGRGRVVFCFTCCHSGGFHFLDLTRAAAPNPSWFTNVVPQQAANWQARLDAPRVAGFVATTEDSLAAGCAPDPDPDLWAGYERFIPEALLGVDLMTGAPKGRAEAGFAGAHIAATLIDRTIDKPHSTSEAFLATYADLIERLREDSQAMTPAVRAQIERYARMVDGEDPGVSDPAFVAQRGIYARFIEALIEQNPSRALVLGAGTREQLEQSIEPASGGVRSGGRGGNRGPGSPAAQAWTETLRPAWTAAVQENRVQDLKPIEREFELHLLAVEKKSRRGLFLPGDREAVRNEVYWRSTYALPARYDADRARVITRWEAARRQTIVAWARQSEDAALRAAADRLAGPERGRSVGRPPAIAWSQRRDHAPREAVQRALFYRRVLGAWAFLLAVGEEGALDYLAELRALESRPFPGGR